MGDVTDLSEFKKKHLPTEDSIIDTRVLTPELVREYKETILLVNQYQDQLSREDFVRAYGMVLNYNHLLMNYIGQLVEDGV